MASRLRQTLQVQSGLLGLVAACSAVFIGAAQADVTISSDATANMACSGGVCAPTASDAILNVTDLENLLAAGNVTVTTTGSGIQANNIVVAANLGWSANALTLDAFQSLSVTAPVAVSSAGGLSILTNDGGSGGALTFGTKGHVSFASLSEPLAINGMSYKLVSSIKTLAQAIKANPYRNYALAGSYDASQDGTYSHSPIYATLTGTVEGLGNVISNLAITILARNGLVGLFAHVGLGGAVNDLGLEQVTINGLGSREFVGALTAQNDGALTGDWVSGKISGSSLSSTGGLAGNSSGAITNCHAAAAIRSKLGYVGGLLGNQSALTATISYSYATGSVLGAGEVGGLTGGASGIISQSFAAGNVNARGERSDAGGLVGIGRGGAIINSYARGAVAVNVPGKESVGGLIGLDGYGDGGANGMVSYSYSIGHVAAGAGYSVGGFAGATGFNDGATDDYWDTKTSGTDIGVGAGSANGITGLTTEQFRASLPQGFDPAIWAQDSKINKGFPYLIANPPPK